jgi:hypothetical protein
MALNFYPVLSVLLVNTAIGMRDGIAEIAH